MAQTAQTFSYQPKDFAKLPLRYLLYLPPDYSKNLGTKWPLMIFLHGAGERGTVLQKVTSHGPPKLIKEGQHFPCVVVSPQCRAYETWDRTELMALLDELQKNLQVDNRRVYLTGISMGGYGSWDLALHHPEKFAAVSPICGGATMLPCLLPGKGKSAHLKRLPIWAFHGAKDDIVPLSESERVVEALRKNGNPVRFTVYPELKHDSWTVTYGNPKFYEWLFAQCASTRKH